MSVLLSSILNVLTLRCQTGSEVCPSDAQSSSQFYERPQFPGSSWVNSFSLWVPSFHHHSVMCNAVTEPLQSMTLAGRQETANFVIAGYAVQ